MPHAARPRSPRLLALAAVTAVLVPLLLAGPAAAEDPAPDQVAAGDTVVGTLVQAFADPEHAEAPGAPAGDVEDTLLSWIDSGDDGAVRVPTEDVADIEVGATVEVTVGAEVRDEATVEQGLEPAREVVEAEVVAPAEPAAATAPTTNAVTVAMVQPAGAPQDGTTLAEVVAAVDGPVRQFWNEQTDGAVTVAVTGRHDWFPTVADCADPFALWEEAAGTIGWNGGAAEHLLLYVPYTADCSYGLGTIGSGIGAGGLAYVQDTATSVLAHELGHNFGLGHSSAVQCDASPETAPCRTESYWDFYDVMGVSWQQVGSLNAPQAARLGMLPSSAQQSVSATGTGGTYTLKPMGSRTGTRVLVLTSGSTRYWVEYRAAVGRDSWLSDPYASYGLEAGVLVHVDGPGPTSDTSLLLDGTPSADEDWDLDEQTVLPPGSPMSLGGGGLTVSVTATSASAVTVTVRTAADGPAPETAIAALYRRLGGTGGWLGSPTTGEQCGLRGGGCLQHFEHGSIYWTAASGAHAIGGAIRGQWGVQGSENGFLGYAVTDEVCGLRGGGCLQHFQGGSIYWTPATGAQPVNGAIKERWGTLGWENGWLGYPAAAAVCGPAAGGCSQVFQGGSVHWSPASGAAAVNPRGAIGGRWVSLRGDSGPLGYPTGNEVCGLGNGGCLQQFQGGTVYWSAASGAQRITGAIRARWGSLGWEFGWLGYPTGDEVCGMLNGGCRQPFQAGWVYWSPAGGAHPLNGAILSRWSAGAERFFGYPTTDAVCGLRGGGCHQAFQGPSIYWSPASGAQPVGGAIRTRWGQLGGENGHLGYPVGPEVPTSAGVSQRFQGGTLSWSVRTGQVSAS
ncbi:uncharacterized protein with LGFP repeats [Geodermatophilus bullaregiensis]|uniref:reprolysin-like metallopeptidase n=1 Tax=Geodermatophilus bullaregiensis TaxID=1564160 RepID=UPI001959E8EB|nr:M66 family metalloprotease [Geodermatophilus bullaregiensis]MBM7805840.1 uncharacterized protein with LGFP repeats [Geodermatophilus bullaregiensis]